MSQVRPGRFKLASDDRSIIAILPPPLLMACKQYSLLFLEVSSIRTEVFGRDRLGTGRCVERHAPRYRRENAKEHKAKKYKSKCEELRFWSWHSAFDK